MFKGILVAFGIAALASAPAAALDRREAETMVDLLERLAEERGEGVYYGDATEWFEFDAENEGLIPAAGFDERRWTIAYDEMMAGFLASIPDATFEALFAAPLARLEASALTDAQKKDIREDLQKRLADVRRARAQGHGHKPAVAALTDRLKALILD